MSNGLNLDAIKNLTAKQDIYRQSGLTGDLSGYGNEGGQPQHHQQRQQQPQQQQPQLLDFVTLDGVTIQVTPEVYTILAAEKQRTLQAQQQTQYREPQQQYREPQQQYREPQYQPERENYVETPQPGSEGYIGNGGYVDHNVQRQQQENLQQESVKSINPLYEKLNISQEMLNKRKDIEDSETGVLYYEEGIESGGNPYDSYTQEQNREIQMRQQEDANRLIREAGGQPQYAEPSYQQGYNPNNPQGYNPNNQQNYNPNGYNSNGYEQNNYMGEGQNYSPEEAYRQHQMENGPQKQGKTFMGVPLDAKTGTMVVIVLGVLFILYKIVM